MTIDRVATDKLLTTTRSVRKRLDLTRDVEPQVIQDCIDIAMQAPTGTNAQNWAFVVITDPAKKKFDAKARVKKWQARVAAGDIHKDRGRLVQANRKF